MANQSLTRRRFLGILGAAAMTGLSARAAAKRKPNILFIMSDDFCTSLGAYRHPQCNTPNLDKLAARGVQFERAFCQFPVCGPSRASIMTGMYPTALGATGNRKSDFRTRHPNLTTLPQLFRQNGYFAGRVSKIYHMGIPGDILEGTPGLDDPLSWDETVNIKAQEQYTPGETTDLCPKVTHQGVDFVRVKADGDDVVNADCQTAEAAVRMLRAHKDEPFFLAVGMVRPHVPLVAPRRFFEPYDPDEMKLVDVPEGDLDDVPKAAQFQANAVKYGMSEEQQKQVLAAYYASVSFMDAQVGKVLDELERLGLRDDTIVVFCSDHGYNLGQHTCWQKLSLFQDSVRVPLLIAAPGMGLENERCPRVIELMDVYPTLAELCGLEPPAELHGESFAPLLTNPADETFKDAASYTITRNQGESLRTERWHYNVWNQGRNGVELYDEQNDPNEYTNLAGDPAYADTLAALEERLKTFRAKAASVE